MMLFTGEQVAHAPRTAPILEGTMRRKLFLAVLIFCVLIQPARVQEKLPEKKQPQSAKPSAESQQSESAQLSKPDRTLTTPKPAERALTPEQFAQLSEKLSEPNGYFDSDNLISN